MDLWSRRVIGWALPDSLEQELVLRALDRAVDLRDPVQGILHHSDHGSQYCSKAYRNRLEELGMTQSMSRRGDCWDHAVVESLFDTLKTEIGVDIFASRSQAHAVVFDYIEVFYNRRRRHSHVGNISPVRFENEQLGRVEQLGYRWSQR